MDTDFSEKVVIITGGSSGIGAACATLFAQHGANLTIVGRNQERLENTAKKCTKSGGKEPLALVLDLTHAGSCETVVTKTAQTYGRIDVLVNCAGWMTISSLYDETMDAFDDIININLRVPYRLTQLALPHLVKTKGNIVNMSTAMLNRVRPGFMPYAIAKAGIENFTKGAGLELASEGVRVNVVSPGVTRTNFMANFNMYGVTRDLAYKRLEAQSPTGNIIEPEEVAKLVLVVASNTFSNLTGTKLMLDGAFSMT